MDRKRRKIFIAVALGTMIGLYGSISFLPSLIWWFGALVGGISAGFIYGLPDIVRYSPTALRVAKNDLKKTGKIFPALFETIRKMPASKRWYFLAGITFFILVFVWAYLVKMFGDSASTMIIGPMTAFFYLLPAEFIMAWSILSPDKNNEAEKIKIAKKAIFFITPPGFLFLLILGLIKLIFVIIEVGPTVAYLVFITLEELTHFLIAFVKALFFFVHSRELVLCAIDAGIGVLISYPLLIAAGNLNIGPGILFGGLIGGLLGVLHYEIVSVRILRVA